ncbi:MAG: hypothetical protein E6J40_07620 [Chloroflexi bacterium]|nr:MAG: hypothetical protein E6J40_07620 [Chloroflexota bacterium]
MQIDWHGSSVLGIAILVAIGVLFGAAGRRWQTLRALAMVLPLIAAVIPLVYFALEGNVSACTGSGSTFRCVEISYASTWSGADWILVGAVVVLTVAPIVSMRLRSRLPSVLAAIVLAGLIAPNLAFLYSWIPAGALVVGAAIAGPPAKGTEPTPAR